MNVHLAEAHAHVWFAKKNVEYMFAVFNALLTNMCLPHVGPTS